MDNYIFEWDREDKYFYLVTEVDAHLAALQAQHAEAMKDREHDNVEAIGLLRNAIEAMGAFIQSHETDVYYEESTCNLQAMAKVMAAKAAFEFALESLVKP